MGGEAEGLTPPPTAHQKQPKLPDQLEYFGFVAFALLHALLHGGDDGVGLVLGAVLRTLLRGPCKAH